MVLGPRRDEIQQPKTLVDLYLGGDYTKLYADVHSRPDHYTDRQKAIITAKFLKQPLNPEPTDVELGGLVEQLTRSTEVEQKWEKIMEKAGWPKQKKPFDIGDEAELLGADGKVASTFEAQDFAEPINIDAIDDFDPY